MKNEGFVAVAVGPDGVRDVTAEVRLRQALRRTCAELQAARGETCGECELHETSIGDAKHVGSAGCNGPMVRTRAGLFCITCGFYPSDDDAIQEWMTSTSPMTSP